MKGKTRQLSTKCVSGKVRKKLSKFKESATKTVLQLHLLNEP